MMKKTIILTSISVILLLTSFPTGSKELPKAGSAVWHVPGDFSTIQEAINASDPYDIIHVAAGTYYEHLKIETHNLTIIGENPNNTVVDGNGTGSVIFLTAFNVTITGFTLQNGNYGINMNTANNCTISNNRLTSNEFDGLRLWGSSNNTISHNTMDSNSDHGLKLESLPPHTRARTNTIVGNLLSGNERGMLLSSCENCVLRDNNMTGNVHNFGVLGSSTINFVHDIDLTNVVDGRPIYYLTEQSNLVIEPPTFANLGYLALVNSDNITVRNLNIANNYQGTLFANTTRSSIENANILSNLYGIYFAFSSNNTIRNNLIKPSIERMAGIYMTNSKHNTLAYNEIDSYYQGIQVISYSSNNTIAENSVSNNEYGIYIGVFSSGNLIYHNNFINNIHQAEISPYSYDNVWDASYPLGGNFWSDYSGDDLYGGPNQDEAGSDGIGDTPYIIDMGNQDAYPLMNAYIVTDLNQDGIIDIYDLTIMGEAYGSEPGDAHWRSKCDLNKDGIVDRLDLEIVVDNYGN
jgi:parallel beta-helix repeat protein